MISKETCVKIYNAYDEIEKSDYLIKNLRERIGKVKDETTPTLSNAFGDRVGLQLGIPSGSNSHSIYAVPFDLSVKIIIAHKEAMIQRLKELHAIARLELTKEFDYTEETEVKQ